MIQTNNFGLTLNMVSFLGRWCGLVLLKAANRMPAKKDLGHIRVSIHNIDIVVASSMFLLGLFANRRGSPIINSIVY